MQCAYKFSYFILASIHDKGEQLLNGDKLIFREMLSFEV